MTYNVSMGTLNPTIPIPIPPKDSFLFDRSIGLPCLNYVDHSMIIVIYAILACMRDWQLVRNLVVGCQAWNFSPIIGRL